MINLKKNWVKWFFIGEMGKPHPRKFADEIT